METDITEIKISVRNLVEFVLRHGDLDNRHRASMDTDTMAAGAKIHRKIQNQMELDYHAEVPLKVEMPYEKFSIVVEGRADGIIDGDIYTIDEIKGVKRDIEYITEPVLIHKAQAMCYAYIYLVQKDLPSIRVQMTYVNLDTEEIKRFVEEFSATYIKQWFTQVTDEYYKWANYLFENKNLTVSTARNLEFPYKYRSGQKEVAINVYKAARMGVDLFVQAPTGIGKTLSTIFPAVKAMGEDICDKLFYLTAKTITGSVAIETFNILRKSGLCIKSVTITAKDKMCMMEETKCNPDYCSFAKGHYDRINDAIYDLITTESDITREKILEYANKHNVCPFEMNLDVSNWVDAIICDYNYAFDPSVRLKRYFGDTVNGKYMFLVDEAHNLVDRAREMYSQVLVKEDVLETKKVFASKNKRVTASLEKLNRAMLSYKRQCDNGFMILPTVDEMIMPLMRFTQNFEKYTEEHGDFDGKEDVLDFYFCAKNFLTVLDVLDENYEIYGMIGDDGRFFVKLMCINPSIRLKECMGKTISTIFFSATLLPVNYYKKLLTGNIEDYAVYIDSPFDKKNRMIAIGSDVTSKYTRRGPKEYEKIANYILNVVTAKKGNYLVFFPSYKMLQDIYDAACKLGLDTRANIILQENSMKEMDREEFLRSFENEVEETLVGFCVMGGIFSEGIDLKRDMLIGTIIVGTGLPQICKERELISDYFKNEGKNGFDYSYKIPGMNKVLQAAGRVIRTDDDKGVIILLDDRFMERSYMSLFPREWDDVITTDSQNITDLLDKFWNQ